MQINKKNDRTDTSISQQTYNKNIKKKPKTSQSNFPREASIFSSNSIDIPGSPN